jgi:hypothetical protein
MYYYFDVSFRVVRQLRYCVTVEVRVFVGGTRAQARAIESDALSA